MPRPLLKTTAPAGALTGAAPTQVPRLALVVADCECEPWRVGELTFLALGKTLFFGRGGENIEEFISIGPHRPGDPLPAHRGFDGCLRGDKISRVQGTMKASETEIEIVNTGKHPMVVNGVAMTRATLRAGDVVAIAGEVVFVCEFRLPEFPALRHATIAHLFGDADAAGIAGESPAAWAMRDEAVGIGRGKDFVIVLGESGTGKTAIAWLIHMSSSRASGPFVVRNAKNLTDTLLEAQLFGKIPNFPNPGPAMEGILPAAHGGTLMLDELGRLIPDAQGHLLVALDNGSYQRLGESKPRTLDVRFIGATNLERSALQGDFHYRFKADMRLVPFRDRGADIMLVAREMLRARLAEDKALMRFFSKGPGGRLYPRLSSRLVEYLLHHPLPGNARDLDALLAKAIRHSDGDRIAMLPDVSTTPSVRPPASAPVSAPPSTEKAEKAPAAAETEVELTREVALAAIADANGNRSEAARRLGIQRSKFYRRLRELGIDGPDEE